MSEGFDPSENPARRGRRDPELAAAMLEDDRALAQAGEPGDQTYLGLVAGDLVQGKITFAAKTPLGDVWYSWGAQTQVLPGETLDSTNERVSAVVTDAVLEMAGEFEGKIGEIVGQNGPTQPTRRIPQR